MTVGPASLLLAPHAWPRRCAGRCRVCCSCPRPFREHVSRVPKNSSYTTHHAMPPRSTCTSECWPDPASPSRPKVIKNTPHFASAIRPCPCARRGGRAVNAANGKPEELIGSRVLPYYNFGRFVGLFLVPCKDTLERSTFVFRKVPPGAA